jgi:hypothetical protein
MEKFSFFVDEKVSTWMRTNFSIEAENLDEAKEKAKMFVQAEDHEDLGWEQIEDVIEEKLTPEDNGNQSTCEIFCADTGEQVFQNGIVDY